MSPPCANVNPFADPLSLIVTSPVAGKTTTTYLLYEILRAAGRRPGLLTNMERRVGEETRPAELNTPEAIDLQRLFREIRDAERKASGQKGAKTP